MDKKRATLPQKLTSLASSKAPRGGGKANWKWALTAVIALASRANVENLKCIAVSDPLEIVVTLYGGNVSVEKGEKKFFIPDYF
jgi:hypothetical protein